MRRLRLGLNVTPEGLLALIEAREDLDVGTRPAVDGAARLRVLQHVHCPQGDLRVRVLELPVHVKVLVGRREARGVLQRLHLLAHSKEGSGHAALVGDRRDERGERLAVGVEALSDGRGLYRGACEDRLHGDELAQPDRDDLARAVAAAAPHMGVVVAYRASEPLWHSSARSRVGEDQIVLVG